MTKLEEKLIELGYSDYGDGVYRKMVYTGIVEMILNDDLTYVEHALIHGTNLEDLTECYFERNEDLEELENVTN